LTLGIQTLFLRESTAMTYINNVFFAFYYSHVTEAAVAQMGGCAARAPSGGLQAYSKVTA
jgi:hypothetical protein